MKLRQSIPYQLALLLCAARSFSPCVCLSSPSAAVKEKNPHMDYGRLRKYLQYFSSLQQLHADSSLAHI